MFDHAKNFKIDNARFHDDHSRTIIGSGNSYNNSYNNSFNDNSRRERVSHHHTTHHHGPIHNIDKAGNVNLGNNYGNLEMAHHEEPEEYPRDTSSDSEGRRSQFTETYDRFYDEASHQAPGNHSRGYPMQDRELHPGHRDYYAPPRPPAAPGGPSPFPIPYNDGRRSHTAPPAPAPPAAQWGSRNPYLRHRDSRDESYPLPPSPPPSAPPSHYPPGHDRKPAGYDNHWHEQGRSGYAYDTRPAHPPRREDRPSGHGGPQRSQPFNNLPPRQATRNAEFDSRGQHQSRSRSRRAPSPDSFSDSDPDSDEFDGPRGTRRMGGESYQFDRAMKQVDRMTERMSRMKF